MNLAFKNYEQKEKDEATYDLKRISKSTGCTNISATKYNYAIEFVIDGFNAHYLVSGANYDLSCTNKGETKIL